MGFTDQIAHTNIFCQLCYQQFKGYIQTVISHNQLS